MSPRGRRGAMSGAGLLLAGLLLVAYVMFPAPFHRAARWAVDAPFRALSDAQQQPVTGPYGTRAPTPPGQQVMKPLPPQKSPGAKPKTPKEKAAQAKAKAARAKAAQAKAKAARAKAARAKAKARTTAPRAAKTN